MRKTVFTILFLGVFTLSFGQTHIKPKANQSVNVSVSASLTRGEVIYKAHCLVCHQADGGGVPNMNPPLINTSWVIGNKGRLIKAVLNGFTEKTDIDGQAFSNTMPPQNFLKDQEIADVLTYIRSGFSNKASAVSISEVKLARRTKK
jgi:mono/diheme cytochrome c family protein